MTSVEVVSSCEDIIVSDLKPELLKSEMTKAQKRLLALVYIMGGGLIVLFVAVVLGFVWQLATLH